MKIGVVDLVWSDWSDLDYNKIHWAAELGFHGMCAKLTILANTVSDQLAAHVRSVYDEQNMPILQLWAPYPSIVSADETVRKAGVEGARDIVRLAANMGIPEAGVRPTSMNPRGDWFPHPDNVKPETEDRLVKSLNEILQTADEHGIDVVLETHVTTTLNSAQSIKRVIERTGSKRLKLNLDPCNFVGDLLTAYNPLPMINEMFDLLGPYVSTVHVKDYYLEDRFVAHISEAIIGTGMMDFEPILRRTQALMPDGYVMIEHLPVSQLPMAKRNLTQKIKELGIPLG
jgi:sugar phosphate isomerase/epimerase